MSRTIKILSSFFLSFLIGGLATAQSNVTTTGGTTNALPKFTGSTTVADSAITESGGNVGIGYSNPGQKLVVVNPNGGMTVNFSNSVDQDLIFYLSTPGATDKIATIGSSTATNLGVAVGDSEKIRVTYGGNVGIGTTSPAYKLSVAGTVQSTTGGFRFPDGTTQTSAAFNTGGTITGVTAGAGLTGGGFSGSVQLAVDGTVARTNVANTFTTQQTFNNYPVLVNNAVLVDNEQSSVYGVRSIVYSGIAGGFWNKRSQDTSLGTGSVILGWAGTNQTPVFHVDTYGTVRALNAVVAFGLDYAEVARVNTSGKYEPGDVLVIDVSSSSRFALSAEPKSRLVAGVFSTQPAILTSTHPMDAKLNEDEVPLAMLGQVPCKVSTENGAIKVGDLLVTAATPGYAMLADDSVMVGTVLGKALEPLLVGKGIIKVLLTLH